MFENTGNYSMHYKRDILPHTDFRFLNSRIFGTPCGSRCQGMSFHDIRVRKEFPKDELEVLKIWEKIFTERGARTKSLVKFVVDSHGNVHVAYQWVDVIILAGFYESFTERITMQSYSYLIWLHVLHDTQSIINWPLHGLSLSLCPAHPSPVTGGQTPPSPGLM